MPREEKNSTGVWVLQTMTCATKSSSRVAMPERPLPPRRTPLPPRHSHITAAPPRSHVFHYIVKDGLVYLCMAEGSFGRRVPFMFLEDVMAKCAASQWVAPAPPSLQALTARLPSG